MTFRELEQLIQKDGWAFKKAVGSHHQYTHPIKKGKVTIPKHGGDIAKPVAHSILKQAGLK